MNKLVIVYILLSMLTSMGCVTRGYIKKENKEVVERINSKNEELFKYIDNRISESEDRIRKEYKNK